MRYLIIMLMAFQSYLGVASAQGIFQYDRIDFFEGAETQKQAILVEDRQNPEIIEDEWAEPIISPTGRMSVYLPPKEVRDFLEEPNPENAKAYLVWNLKRIKKLILAQQLLTKEAKDLGYMRGVNNLTGDPSGNLKDSLGNSESDANYLFYFMSKGCPACEKETRVIENIYLNHPEIRIEAFAKGFSDQELDGFGFPAKQDKGMSNLFKITSYPSVAVFNKNKQKYFISGFVGKEKILGLFK